MCQRPHARRTASSAPKAGHRPIIRAHGQSDRRHKPSHLFLSLSLSLPPSADLSIGAILISQISFNPPSTWQAREAAAARTFLTYPVVTCRILRCRPLSAQKEGPTVCVEGSQGKGSHPARRWGLSPPPPPCRTLIPWPVGLTLFSRDIDMNYIQDGAWDVGIRT
ncbi:hypothetical protein LY76DRAFT_127311 [Colletotrichum caudatum]|nr:hypothetical protein LY76DRAFT_127311 [Colletotrichum caudatum]